MTKQMDTNVTMSTINAISNFTGIEELQGVRSFMDEHSNPWFVLADICRILGIGNPRDVFSRLESWEKGVGTIDTLGGPQQMNVINEAGLYDLIATSRRPEAMQFKYWIYKELIPRLRIKYSNIMNGMTGGRIDVMEIMPPVVLEETNRRLQEKQLEIDKLRQQNQALKNNNRGLTNRVNSLDHHIEILNNRRDMANSYRDDKLLEIRGIVDDLLDRV